MIDVVAATPETVAQAGTTAIGFANTTYWLAIAALTAVLVWGFRMLSKELQQPVHGNQSAGEPTFFRMVLTEKAGDTSTEGKDSESTTRKVDEGSFSRVAGAIGAIGIAATFVGISYWVLHTLFFDIGNLTQIEGLGTYFLAGSAMFLPYAFNQIASIFRP